MWLSKVEDATGETIKVDWKPFSLAQVNSDNNDGNVKLWELPEVIDGTDKTFLAHMSGLAAKRQGDEAFQSFFMALLRARHEDKKDLLDPAVMEEAAVAAGLDMARFREDAADPELLKDIGESHTNAVEEYGAFGVPTFVFGDGKATFLKMFIPPDEQAVEIYETLTKVMSEFEHVGEIKRPQPPWPHGVI
ncbi:MAG: DsbA family protein [Chloroflexi bacterium]|nr:DsbA family protein [Chloroflexota bacterium]MCI0800712.1 DsbA family protein [Chloroflexota bacterium]MCI0811840.1 DsbA family protein [Chloroflexota bacterium]MCI0848132.1 DsbA family protein [Chloroflexota bacterium]MCI0900026.1 DsbA family protein [Chloroflexota bacterium]